MNMAANMHLNMRHMTVITVVMMCDDEDFDDDDDDDDDNKDDVDDDDGDDGGGDCDDAGQRTEEGYQVPETRHWHEGGSGLPSAGIQALVCSDQLVETRCRKPGTGWSP